MLISWLWLDTKLSQICLLIDSALYSAVAWLYELFLKIARAEVFSNNVYENFAQRVYVVLGIVMLFVLAYNLLKAIVDPDNFTKGDKSFSKVAINLVISLIIIGILPIAFQYARKLQNFILENNVIGTLMFGNNEMDVSIQEYDENGNVSSERIERLTAKEVADAQINSYGRIMAFTSLNAFLNPENKRFQYDAGEFTVENGYVNPLSGLGCLAGGVTALGITISSLGTGAATIAIAAVSCLAAGGATNGIMNAVDYTNYTWDQMKLTMIYDGDFTQIISLANVLHEGAKSMDGNETIEIRYSPFISSLCAGFLIYLLCSFCIDLGVRSVRLAFLQLMAPIPIFMRAMPGKHQQFDKWLKKTITTYLEVFVRVFLMYMAVYFLSNLKVNLNTWEGVWVDVILTMGIIAFVKEAPKLIADITGIDSGNMKIGIMPKLAAGGALTALAVGGGLATSAIQGGTRTVSNMYKARQENKGNGLWENVRAIGSEGLRGVWNTGTGVISGGIRSGYAARSAKNISDVRKGASAGAKAVSESRDRAEAYRLAHQNEPFGVGGAQIKDAWTRVKDFAGASSSSTQDLRAKEAASAIQTMISNMQNVWKNDEGWKKADEIASQARGAIYEYGDFTQYSKDLAARKKAYLAQGHTEAQWKAIEASESQSVMDDMEASGTLDSSMRVNFENAINVFNSKDQAAKNIAKSIQSQKASQLAGQAQTVATYMEKYADILPTIFSAEQLNSLNSLDLANVTADTINDKVYKVLGDAKIGASEAISDIERRNILRRQNNNNNRGS